MVEHNDDFGTSEPTPEPAPEGGLGDLNLDAPNPASEPGEPVPPAYGEARADAPTHPEPAPPAIDAWTSRPVVPSLLAAAIVIGLGAAWAYFAKPWEPRAAAKGPESAARATSKPKPAPSVAEVSAGVQSLQSEVDGLRDDLKGLRDRVEAIPKPAPPPDLGPINDKIADLARNSEAVADLPKKFDGLDERVGTIDKSLADLRGALDALKSEVDKKTGESTTATPAAPAPAEDVNVSDAALNQAVDLFKAGKYKEAYDAFRKLTEAQPDDARVWYYAALSRGSATKDWTGETTRMVEKGVEREKAGTPETSRIDAVFANLNPSFKPWLDAYRKGAKSR